MSRFDIYTTPINDLMVVDGKPIFDGRGAFCRLFCEQDLTDVLKERRVTQVNRSFSKNSGTVRGMHLQLPPSAESKLVFCLSGSVLDVAVDLRRGSSHFLEWHAEELSADNAKGLFIPEGFAHGFQTLEDDTSLIYFHTASYDQSSECGLNPLDPVLSIAWPLPISDMSEKDRSAGLVSGDFKGYDIASL